MHVIHVWSVITYEQDEPNLMTQFIGQKKQHEQHQF